MEPSTRDILVEFMNTHLKQRGHEFLPPLPVPTSKNGHKNKQNQSSTTGNNSKDYRKSLNEICQSLNEISNELHEFISKAYNDKFRESIDVINLEEPDYQALDTIADELFRQDITWFHILTFLHYGAELACKAIEGNDDSDESYNMVYQIIDWMCKYIDKKLLKWIKKQDGGWMSINDYKDPKNKGLRHYLGYAAFFAFVGGLYLCSKFTSQ